MRAGRSDQAFVCAIPLVYVHDPKRRAAVFPESEL